MENAFDKVNANKLFLKLRNTGLKYRDRRIIKSKLIKSRIQWKPKITVNGLKKEAIIKKGVRQW